VRWDLPLDFFIFILLDLCSLHFGLPPPAPLFPQASTGAGPSEWAGTLGSSGAAGAQCELRLDVQNGGVKVDVQSWFERMRRATEDAGAPVTERVPQPYR